MAIVSQKIIKIFRGNTSNRIQESVSRIKDIRIEDSKHKMIFHSSSAEQNYHLHGSFEELFEAIQIPSL